MRSSTAGRLAVAAVFMVGSAATLVSTLSAPATAATSNAYGGSATGTIVSLSAVTIPGTLQAANVNVAPATTNVSSTEGIAAAPGKNSYARAANLDADLLNGAIPLNNLVVNAVQTAPPDNTTPVTKNLLSVPADPLLNATVADATAQAHWLGATCVPVGTPIATATSDLATANVLTGTPLGAAAVSVVNSSGGPVTSNSEVQMVNVGGQSGEGVESSETDQITGVILFKGSANELTINVLAPPNITAVATGKPGTASVTYTEPIVQILMGTKVLATLDAKTADTSLTIPALATISLGKLTSTVAANGTSASGSADLLDIAIGVSPLPLNVATIAIAPSSVAASVPSGGVYCPPASNPLDEAHKDASAGVVGPGQQFNYTVTVPNRGTCTLVNVKIVDTITAPAGTTIVSSVPPADSTSGDTLTYTIASLPPNATDNIQITLKAPPNLVSGTEFHNHADISGLCSGAAPGTPPFTKSVDINGPQGFVPGFPGCHLDDSNKVADHVKVFVGETFDYYIHVLNDGKSPCTAVSITDKVPSTVTFVSATDGGVLSGGVVTWHLGTIASGASRSVVLEVSVNKGDSTDSTLPNTAVVSSPNEHPISLSTIGPTVTGISVLSAPDLPEPGALNGLLPVTGGQPWAPYGLGFLAVGLAGWGWRRRMHRTA